MRRWFPRETLARVWQLPMTRRRAICERDSEILAAQSGHEVSYTTCSCFLATKPERGGYQVARFSHARYSQSRTLMTCQAKVSRGKLARLAPTQPALCSCRCYTQDPPSVPPSCARRRQIEHFDREHRTGDDELRRCASDTRRNIVYSSSLGGFPGTGGQSSGS